MTLKIAAGVLLGAAGLWLTFRGLDIGAIADIVRRAHLPSIAAAVLLVAATVALVARRWQLLVDRQDPVRHVTRYVAPIVVGQMLNVLLPIRLGEALRAYWIGKTAEQPIARVIATLVIERLADLIVLGLSVLALLLQLSLPSWAKTSGQLTLLFTAIAIVAALVLVRWGPAGLRLLEHRQAFLPERIRRFLVREGDMAFDELRAFGDWRASAQVWGLSLLIVALAAATNLVLFRAFDLSLSPAVALLLFVVMQIGLAPAATPGNVGVFHYLVVLVLTGFGVDRVVAVAYAIVLHAVAYGPKIVVGALIVTTLETPLLTRAAWNHTA